MPSPSSQSPHTPPLRTSGDAQPTRQMTGIVNSNIGALLEQRRERAHERSRPDRIADAVTRFAGSITFVVLHAVLFGVWLACNLPGVPLPHFDPSFVTLAMFASVEAIFLSTFVLISQNRMQAQSDRQAALDLQVNLLAEHEITRLVELITLMADKMGIEQARDPELQELAQDVRPERVMCEIEAAEARFHAEPSGAR